VARQGVGVPHVTRFLTGWPVRRPVHIEDRTYLRLTPSHLSSPQIASKAACSPF